LKKNLNNNFFPSDFFSPIVSSSTNNAKNNKFKLEEKPKSKSIYINLRKEEEEDLELIELLEGKKSKNNSTQEENQINYINEIIKEEDEYKNKNLKESEKVIIKKKHEGWNNKMDNVNKIYNNKLLLNNNNIKFETKIKERKNEIQLIKNRSISTNKTKFRKYVNLNSMTNDTSSYTSSLKKSIPFKKDKQNRTEDASNFRTGLFSAVGSSNNNVIIPIIPMRRPNSNFIFGAEQLWYNFEKGIIKNNVIDKSKNDKTEVYLSEKKNIEIIKSNNDDIKKITNCQRYNMYNKSRNNTNQDNKKKYNTFIGVNNLGIVGKTKIINKLHKIKIEKGMMNSGIVSNLNKKLLGEYHSRIKQFKNSYLPMVFNGSSKKNKINIISKFENAQRNKFRSKSCNKESID